MTSPLTVIPRSEDPQTGPPSPSGSADPPFIRWLWMQIRHVHGAAALLAGVAAAVYNASIAVRLRAPTQVGSLQLLYATQAAIILVIVGFIAFGKRPRLFQGYPRGSAAVEQFWEWWPNLWVAWLVLYGALAGAGVLGFQLEEPRVTVVFHLINNCATLVLMRCYHILAHPTIPADVRAEGDIFPEFANDLPASTPQGVATGAAGVEVSAGGARFVFWVCLFLVAVGVEAALVWHNHQPAQHGVAQNVVFVFGLSYGVLAAVATAMLVGQLDSPLLGVPPYAIVILFFYAAIQPTYDVVLAVSANEPSARLVAVGVIVTVALVGKLCLFAIVQWLALSNRLFYYMVQNFTLYERVASHRSAWIDARLSAGGAR